MLSDDKHTDAKGNEREYSVYEYGEAGPIPEEMQEGGMAKSTCEIAGGRVWVLSWFEEVNEDVGVVYSG